MLSNHPFIKQEKRKSNHRNNMQMRNTYQQGTRRLIQEAHRVLNNSEDIVELAMMKSSLEEHMVVKRTIGQYMGSDNFNGTLKGLQAKIDERIKELK